MKTPNIYLEAKVAQAIAQTREQLNEAQSSIEIEISLDLGLSTQSALITKSKIEFNNQTLQLSDQNLQTIINKPRKVFKVSSDEESPQAIEIFGESHYQLVPTRGAPTAEIDGIQMHLTSKWTPFEWAEEAMRQVIRGGERVFESCGGLGYMAIQAIRLGAKEVQSCELSEEMIWLRTQNPWSQIGDDLSIELTPGDAFKLSRRQEPQSYEVIIHDPPRLSMAPDLYETSFYKSLNRLLKKNGRMFHYTGHPNRQGSGKRFLERIRKNLLDAGFKVSRNEDLQGFVTEKLK